MAGQRQKIQKDVRFRVLRFLEENPEMSQQERQPPLVSAQVEHIT